MICGILLGLGAAAGGVYIMNSANHDPLLTRVQSGDDKATALTEKATKMKDAALMVRRMVDIAPSLEEAWVPRAAAKDGKLPRFTPLFFAPSIWEVPDAAQKKNVAVDLLDNESRPLHKMASADASTPAVFLTRSRKYHLLVISFANRQRRGRFYERGGVFFRNGSVECEEHAGVCVGRRNQDGSGG